MHELLDALIRFNLVAAAAIIVVLALRPFVRDRFGARATYALWALPSLAAVASLLPARRVIEQAAPTLATDAAPLPTNLVAEAFAPAPLLDAAAAPAAALAQWHVGPELIVGAWAFGVALSIAILAWRQHRFVSQLGPLQPDATIFRAARVGIGPALIGALAPRIVVPANFEESFTSDERALILAHEHTHLRKGDAQVNALIALFTSLNWFNPLVHVAARMARRDQELACDADVIAQHPEQRRTYAQALLKSQTLQPAPFGCAWPAGGAHPLHERIALIVTLPPSRAHRTVGAVAVTALCLSAAATAWAAQPAVHVIEPAGPEPLAAPRLEPIALEQDAPRLQNIQATASLNETFPNLPVEIRSMAALLRVIPEDRDDIAVSIAQSGRLPAAAARIEDGQLLIDGGLGEAAHRCDLRFTGAGVARVPGRGDVRAEDLPVITLRTPRRLDIQVRGVVASRFGRLDGGRVQIEGCGDARLEDVRGAFNIGLYGFGNVDVGTIDGDLTARLFGIGDLSIGRVSRDARLDLYGTGDLTTGDVAGALTALMQGAGDMRVTSVGAGATVRLPGVGGVTLAALNGPNLDVDIGGAGDVRVGRGAVERMRVEISGSGAVDFDGRANYVSADLGMGAGEVRVREAGRVEQSNPRRSVRVGN